MTWRALILACFLGLATPAWNAAAPGGLDLCDPVSLNAELLKTLSPAEMKCVWRRLKKMSHQVRTYEGFLIEVNDYGAHFDGRVLYQQSSSSEGKRSGNLTPVAVSDYHASKDELELWNIKMAEFKAMKNDRILIPSISPFEGRQLIRCDHLFNKVVRYSEWLDSKSGLVLRVAGFDPKGRLFFARIYASVNLGEALGPEPKFDSKRANALGERLSKSRLEKIEDAGEFIGSLKLDTLGGLK